MALAKLVEEKKVSDIITQNTDGLHMRAGVPTDKLHEVYGNQNVEKCTVCSKVYMRDTIVRSSLLRDNDHLTGRTCDDPKCQGPLQDTLVYKGEQCQETTRREAWMAGFCGCDLMVTAGNDLPDGLEISMIPYTAAVGGAKVVIINKFKTSVTQMAQFQIFADCDEVFDLLMEKLDLEVPEFKLERYIKIGIEADTTNCTETYTVSGVDANLNAFNFLDEIKVNGKADKATMEIDPNLMFDYMADETNFVQIDLKFQGNFGESDLSVKVPRKMIKRNRGTAHAIMLKMVNDMSAWTEVTPTRFCKFIKEPIGELEFTQPQKNLEQKFDQKEVSSLAEQLVQYSQISSRQ